MLILVIVSVVDGGAGSSPMQLCFVKWDFFFFVRVFLNYLVLRVRLRDNEFIVFVILEYSHLLSMQIW